MAKISQAVLLLVAAICVSSLVGIAQCHDKKDHDLVIMGKVYCDACRVGFETPASEILAGAKVTLECKDREGGHLTYEAHAETGADGWYQIGVQGDHAEEVCEVVVKESPILECNEHVLGLNRGRVLVTKDNGIASPIRYVNALGFLKKTFLPICPKLLSDIGLVHSECVL